MPHSSLLEKGIWVFNLKKKMQMTFNTRPAFPRVRAQTLFEAASFRYRCSQWPQCFLEQKARQPKQIILARLKKKKNTFIFTVQLVGKLVINDWMCFCFLQSKAAGASRQLMLMFYHLKKKKKIVLSEYCRFLMSGQTTSMPD